MILKFVIKAAMDFERSIGTAILACALAAGAPAAEDLEEIVRRQSAEIAKLGEEVRTLRNEQKTDLEHSVQEYLVGTKEEEADGSSRSLLGGRVRLGGYTSVLFRDDGEGKASAFDGIRFVPKIQAEVADGISVDAEIEFEGGGAGVDFLTGNEILVEYAEIAFEVIDEKLVLKAGLVLIPWGRFNQFHDDPMNDLTDRPLVSRYLGATAFDQPGVEAEGAWGFGGGWFLDWDVALTQGLDDDITTADGARGGRQSFRADNNENKELWWRVVLAIPATFLDAFELGHSGTLGKYDDASAREVFGWAFELFLRKGPFELVAEYMNLEFDRDSSAPASDPRRMDGWYVEGRYHFFPPSWRGRHKLLNEESTFTLVVRVEAIDLNHATSGTAFRDDLGQWTVGLNFRPVERTAIKISYTFVDTDQAGAADADYLTLSCATYF